jgi:hypothetical protein
MSARRAQQWVREKAKNGQRQPNDGAIVRPQGAAEVLISSAFVACRQGRGVADCNRIKATLDQSMSC